MISIKQATDYILSKVCELGRGVSPLKLQKLLYYVQSWHLALEDSVLFQGKFQAWVHGPVNRDVYDRFASEYSLYSPISYERLSDYDADFSGMPEEDKLFINEVLDAYAGFSGDQLEDLSHSEMPWINARIGLREGERSERFIQESDMKEYYASLCKTN